MSKTKLNKNFKKGKNFGAREIDLDSPEFEEMDRAVEEEKFKIRHKKPNHKNYKKDDDYDS